MSAGITVVIAWFAFNFLILGWFFILGKRTTEDNSIECLLEQRFLDGEMSAQEFFEALDGLKAGAK